MLNSVTGSAPGCVCGCATILPRVPWTCAPMWRPSWAPMLRSEGLERQLGEVEAEHVQRRAHAADHAHALAEWRLPGKFRRCSSLFEGAEHRLADPVAVGGDHEPADGDRTQARGRAGAAARPAQPRRPGGARR